MDFELLKKQVAEDLNLTPDTAELKSLKISSIYIRYLDLYMENLRKLKSIQSQKESVYAKLVIKFQREGVDGYAVKGKDCDYYACLDTEYQAKVGEVKEQEFIVSYLEKVLEQINKVSFNIKNFCDLQKVKLGIG